MKATKLASIFAVTAVAAAVSTTTFAAEPVFSGSAGLDYVLTDGDEEWTSEGEVNIIIDTGSIYIDMDMGSYHTDYDSDENEFSFAEGFVIDEAYATKGAVQFGDFDGSLSGDAQYTAGVWEEGEYGIADNTDLGIRYTVVDGLVVALEMVEGLDGVGYAGSYEAGLGALTLGLSAGAYTSEDESVDFTTFSLGLAVDMGMISPMLSYSAGEDSDADFSSMVVGADLAFGDAVAFSIQYSSDLEAEEDNLEITGYYTADDFTFYATNQSGDVEATVLGAYVSF